MVIKQLNVFLTNANVCSGRHWVRCGVVGALTQPAIRQGRVLGLATEATDAVRHGSRGAHKS